MATPTAKLGKQQIETPTRQLPIGYQRLRSTSIDMILNQAGIPMLVRTFPKTEQGPGRVIVMPCPDGSVNNIQAYLTKSGFRLATEDDLTG